MPLIQPLSSPQLQRRLRRLSELVAELRTDVLVREPRPVPVDERRALSDRQAADLVADFQTGVPTVELAKRYGVHLDTVYRCLHRSGVQLRAWHRLTDDNIVDAQGRYEAGDSIRAIADRFGVNRDTMRRHLVERGVVLRGPNSAIDPDHLAEATRRYQAGASLADIARLLRVHQQTARAILEAAGVTIRRRGLQR